MNFRTYRTFDATSKPIRGTLAGKAATTGYCLIAGLALVVSASSNATVFNVDSLASTAKSGQVQTYLQAIIAPGSMLTATGASQGNAADGAATAKSNYDTSAKTYASSHFTQVTIVPEPSSLPLAGIGLALAGLAGWLSRRGARRSSTAA